MTKDSLDKISAATENAIVYLGDTIAESLSYGYDAAAKSMEETVFPVPAESRNSMRRESPSRAKTAAPEQEIVLDREFANRVEHKALEKEYKGMLAEKVTNKASETEKRKPAKRALALPSFRKNRPRQQQQSQAHNHDKKNQDKKKGFFAKDLRPMKSHEMKSL